MSSGGSASARRRRASTWWVVGGIIVLAAAGIVWLQQGPSISAGSREDISARHVRRWMQRLSGGDVKDLTEYTGYSSPKRLARTAKASLRGAAREANGIHVRRMQRKVEAVRNLTFKRPIKTRFLSPEDFVYRYADPMLGGMVQAGFMVQERLLV